jgi:hypothetical protein
VHGFAEARSPPARFDRTSKIGPFRARHLDGFASGSPSQIGHAIQSEEEPQKVSRWVEPLLLDLAAGMLHK